MRAINAWQMKIYIKHTAFIYLVEMLNGMQMKCDAVYSFATHFIIRLRLEI